MDFFLEKRSPLVNFSEKKHAIAGRYTNPPYDSLLQNISILIQRANNKLNPEKPSPYLLQGAQVYFKKISPISFIFYNFNLIFIEIRFIRERFQVSELC